MELLKHMEWRYATKRFDKEKKVSPEKITLLKRAIQLSVSSYGLQLYKVLVVENEDIREKLRIASWGQSQITEASHLFVFCNYMDARPNHIDDFIKLTAEIRGIPLESLSGYGDFIKEKLGEKTPEERYYWLKCQTYIAMANLLSACSELKIDACPMEGFDAEQYNSILDLTKEGLSASVIVTVGYRNENDRTQMLEKVRKPSDILFENV